jgi:dTDP-4-dehydrorhamnose 3,5-epimerase
MHYQLTPYAETKLVRCTQGEIFDVIIDLRPSSPTYKRYMSIHLSSDNRKMLYIPEGFAHGFQTLVDATEVLYQMSEFFRAEAARGVRWNDPVFGIVWPSVDQLIIADRDRNYPDFMA